MTDLTDKWKKGELPSRDDDHCWLAYYIKHKDGYIHADSLWRGQWGTADRNSIEEILAPVPNYEEWLTKLEENTKLKELLKECRSLLSFLQINDYDNNGLLVIGRINQALGEDK